MLVYSTRAARGGKSPGQSRAARAAVRPAPPTLLELSDAPFAEDVDELGLIRAPFLLPGIVEGLRGGKRRPFRTRSTLKRGASCWPVLHLSVFFRHLLVYCGALLPFALEEAKNPVSCMKAGLPPVMKHQSLIDLGQE